MLIGLVVSNVLSTWVIWLQNTVFSCVGVTPATRYQACAISSYPFNHAPVWAGARMIESFILRMPVKLIVEKCIRHTKSFTQVAVGGPFFEFFSRCFRPPSLSFVLLLGVYRHSAANFRNWHYRHNTGLSKKQLISNLLLAFEYFGSLCLDHIGFWLGFALIFRLL